MRARRLGGMALLLIMGGVVASCMQSAPPPPKFPAISFTGQPKIPLRVGAIEIAQDYTPPLEAPNVDHQFPIPPAQMAARWAQDRLLAAGGTGTARFVIKQASVLETELARTEGIRGAFTKDQAQRYDAVLEVEIEIRNDRGFRDGIVTARIERSRSVEEGIDINQRQAIWYEMTKDMAQALDAEMERTIRANLTAYLAG